MWADSTGPDRKFQSSAGSEQHVAGSDPTASAVGVYSNFVGVWYYKSHAGRFVSECIQQLAQRVNVSTRAIAVVINKQATAD